MRLLPFLFFTVVAVLAKDEDPEIYMTTPQIIERWGYKAEIHYVTTEDGYILEIHRIPIGKTNPNVKGPRPVIFMQHGLECSSSNWIVNLPNESAGFLFADAGFDVWLGNMRGNTYAMNHTTLNYKEEKFWEFSWDEMAKYDLDAMINYALKVSGQDSLYYMGHSQGTLTMFAKLSTDASFASKIKKFFALGPVGTVKNIKGLFAFLAHHFSTEFKDWVDVFGAHEFTPSSNIIKAASADVCGGLKIENDLCDELLFLIAGPESHQLNDTRVPIYTSHTPAGTSSVNVEHWLQMVQNGNCAMYDHGRRQNLKKYGQATPPEYDFTRINTPVYLYWGGEDWLADPTDVKEFLIPKISHTIVENHDLSDYNHLDFIWGLRAATDIYLPIIDMIEAEN